METNLTFSLVIRQIKEIQNIIILSNQYIYNCNIQLLDKQIALIIQ